MNVQLKNHMKQAFLGTLNSPEKPVRNAVANLIAAIASIELPRKEWDDLLPSLTATSGHEDPHVRLTALTSLGYICEEVDQSCITEHANAILYALTNNMSDLQTPEAVELTTQAIRAFQLSIKLASANF